MVLPVRTTWYVWPLAVGLLLLGTQRGQAQAVRPTAASVEQQLLDQLSGGPAQLPAATTAAGLLNVAQLTQQGSMNAAQITQVGSSNVTIVSQSGTGNVVTSTITGTGTRSEISQTGARNLVDQELAVDQRKYVVQQQGFDNQLKQVERGAQAPPGYEVKMVGNGINMTIQQGRPTY
jgi:hypothetical protein